LRLEIVVSRSCLSCEEARVIAGEMESRFPNIEVDVIDIGEGRRPPANVFATPTYLLDGAIISLGNPKREELISTIVRKIGYD
jgi:hypothetical protein